MNLRYKVGESWKRDVFIINKVVVVIIKEKIKNIKYKNIVY